MDTAVDDQPVPELKPGIQGPAEEATNQDPSLNVAEVFKPQSQNDCPLTESIHSFPGVFTDSKSVHVSLIILIAQCIFLCMSKTFLLDSAARAGAHRSR